MYTTLLKRQTNASGHGKLTPLVFNGSVVLMGPA